VKVISVSPVQNGFSPPPPPPVITPDGTLAVTGAAVSTGLTTPSAVTFDPQGRFVFVSDVTAGKIAVFSFNESTAAMAAIGTAIRSTQPALAACRSMQAALIFTQQ
jgi:6-phosphogluconolactonase (cycloisomerase 2 family)